MNSLSADFPLADSLEVFFWREDAEQFTEEVRGDDPEVAAWLRIDSTATCPALKQVQDSS